MVKYTPVKKNTLQVIFMDILDEKVENAMLFDFYGDLLKSPNKEMYEDYVLNDYSLSEVAESYSVTRQAVHDVIKRTSAKLKDYEDKLHLVQKYKLSEEWLDEIISLSEELGEKGKRIHSLAEQIKINGI